MNTNIPAISPLGFCRQDNGPNTVSFSIPVANSSPPDLDSAGAKVEFFDNNAGLTDQFEGVEVKYSKQKKCLLVKAKHKKKIRPSVEINGTAGYFAVTIQFGPPTSPTTEICQLPGVLYDE